METKSTIYAKLLKFQEANVSIPKNKENPHFKSRYADLSSIIEKINPELTKAGLVISHSIKEGNVITSVIDSESGESVTAEFPLFGSKAQEYGSSITYARRYNIGSLLNLNIDDDDDGNVANDAPRTQSKREYDQTEDENKQWMNDAEFVALTENWEKFPTAQDAIKAARTKYKVSKAMASQIEDFYTDKLSDQPF